MRRLMLILMLIMLMGCSTGPSTPTFGSVASREDEPFVASQTSAPDSPSTTDQLNPTKEKIDSKLVPYHNDLIGISFSYAENLNEPEITQTGIPTLKLDLRNGELSILWALTEMIRTCS